MKKTQLELAGCFENLSGIRIGKRLAHAIPRCMCDLSVGPSWGLLVPTRAFLMANVSKSISTIILAIKAFFNYKVSLVDRYIAMGYEWSAALCGRH